MEIFDPANKHKKKNTRNQNECKILKKTLWGIMTKQLISIAETGIALREVRKCQSGKSTYSYFLLELNTISNELPPHIFFQFMNRIDDIPIVPI